MATISACRRAVSEATPVTPSTDLVPVHDILQEIAETVGILGAHDQVDFRHPTEELLPLLLGHAPIKHVQKINKRKTPAVRLTDFVENNLRKLRTS